MEETITPAIKICDVRKRYGQHEVLQGIDMEVMPREVVCLIGPSGSGKSTLLRCVNFLEVYDEGEILVEGALMGYEMQYNGTRRRAGEARIGGGGVLQRLVGDPAQGRVRVMLYCFRTAQVMTPSTASTTLAAVMPRNSKTFPAGPHSPKRSIPITAPSRPT